MKATDFCYWLQGLFELSNPQELNERQTTLIKRHLHLVFKHDIDPQAGPPEYQHILQGIHDGTSIKIGGTDKDGNLMRC